MSAHRKVYRSSLRTTALLLGLSLSAACGDTPTHNSGDGGPAPVPTPPAAVSTVQVTPDTLTLLATGGHLRVDATARAADGAVLGDRWASWTTSDATVATVDAAGNVTGHLPGRAWITGTVEGRTARARVDVVAVTVDSIALAARMDVPWRTTRQLAVTLYAADDRVLQDRAVEWTTSDPAVATVDGTGRVTGVAGGHAWITATSEGKTARTEIVVPLVRAMTLETAAGRALPATVLDTVYDEGKGRRRRVRLSATEGRLALHSRDGTYTQRVVLRIHERSGTCTEWGSCIWALDETVTERVVSDHGRIESNVHTGEPIFVSDSMTGWTYYAQDAPADAYTVWQGLPGTGAVLPWLYRL